ncbi:3002_t:CDS:2, partial [Ambispora leptoticha]
KRHFDMVHNENIATRRAQERCRNRTPPSPLGVFLIMKPTSPLRLRLLKQNQLNYINIRANDFMKDDLEALRVKFQPASKDHIIPNGKVEEFPEQYVCSKINRDMLDKAGFKVQEISDFSFLSFEHFLINRISSRETHQKYPSPALMPWLMICFVLPD